VTAFLRLLEYARPYRGRLAGAVAAMIVYGLRRPASPISSTIFDEVLPTGQSLGFVASAVLGLYLFKGSAPTSRRTS
jgi:hypothetical protein